MEEERFIQSNKVLSTRKGLGFRVFMKEEGFIQSTNILSYTLAMKR